MEWVVSVSFSADSPSLTCLSDRDKQGPARQKERKSSLHSTGCPTRIVALNGADNVGYPGFASNQQNFSLKFSWSTPEMSGPGFKAICMPTSGY